MSDTIVEQRPANPKAGQWAERIAAQQRAGISVKQFCKEQGATEYSFYAWRKRLQQTGPVRFALADRSPRRPAQAVSPRELFERHGIEISRKTMGGWMAQCAKLLDPLYQLMK